MGKKLTVLKIFMILVSLGIIAIPITAAYSFTQIQYIIDPISLQTSARIDNNGIITKNYTLYISNFGFYDINSIVLFTNVLDESFFPYGELNPLITGIPRNSIMPIKIMMLVNTTKLTNDIIGEFLNTSSFLGQIFINVRHAFSMIGLSLPLITSTVLSPMYNLSNGPASSNNTHVNVTFGFLNLIQSYTLNLTAELRNGSGLVATGYNLYSVPSTATFGDIITVTNSSGNLVSGNYELTLRVTSPFVYEYKNSSFSI